MNDQPVISAGDRHLRTGKLFARLYRYRKLLLRHWWILLVFVAVALGVETLNLRFAPVVFSFPARAWRTMKLPSVGGAWSCQNGYPDYGADGETSGYCVVAGGPTNFNSIGPLSGYHLTDFVGALAGVFLEDTLPASAAPALRFYVSDNSEGGIQTDFPALSPQIGQVFFIGDGLTGTGSGEMQTFKVPPTATHLYLGYVDNCMARATPRRAVTPITWGR